MIRVVLDTNVVVSAVLVPKGLEALVLLLCVRGYIQACFSPALLAEYELVLRRPRLKLPLVEVERVLANVRGNGLLVHPTRTMSISMHEADNRIYECSATAGAKYIVTGNKKHFPEDHEGAEIVNARQLLYRLRQA
jgi:putative PIN family toxin of toxin-antitoxin system